MSEIFPETPLTSLPAAVAAMGALPMPVDPETSLPQGRERAELLARYERALASFCADPGAAARAVAGVRDAEAEWLLRDAQRLQDRVIVLEAERHSTNEALPDAAEALHAGQSATYGPALPWAVLLDREDLTDFLDELAAAAVVHASSESVLAEVEKVCSTWRLIAEAQHAHNTAPGPSVQESADKLSRLLAPLQALREDAYESPLHHEYRVPHDLPDVSSLPVPPSCGLSADELDEVSRDVRFGGGAQ